MGEGNKWVGEAVQGGWNNRRLTCVITSPASCNNHRVPSPFPMLHVAPVAEKAVWQSQCGISCWLAVQTAHNKVLAHCDSSPSPFSHSELLSEVPWPGEVCRDQFMTRVNFVTNHRGSFPYFVYSNNVSGFFCKITQVEMAFFAAHKITLMLLSEDVLPEASPTLLQQFIFLLTIIPQYVPIQQAILFTQVNKQSILYSNLCCKVCTYITVAVTNALNCLIY